MHHMHAIHFTLVMVRARSVAGEQATAGCVATNSAEADDAERIGCATCVRVATNSAEADDAERIGCATCVRSWCHLALYHHHSRPRQNGLLDYCESRMQIQR